MPGPVAAAVTAEKVAWVARVARRVTPCRASSARGCPAGVGTAAKAATAVAVVAGLTYNFLPFMVLPIYASLERADPKIIEAGGDLYANGFTTFRTVTLPMSMPGVLAGTLLTFIPAAGDYVNAELLGSDISTKMVGNGIESQFFKVLGGYPIAAALSFTLMAVILALVFLYVRRYGTEELL